MQILQRKMEDDHLSPELLHLKLALLAMEPTNCIISLARKASGGHITEEIQSFILEHCDKSNKDKCVEIDATYMKSVLKKVISIAESSHEAVLEGIYEQYANYMSCIRDNDSSNASHRVLKFISFLFNEDNYGIMSRSKNFSIPLQCSMNMLEGDTGCVIWPASLYLSEFILSNLDIFSEKYCFEIGAGVGLLGVVLKKVKASKVILSDGDFSSVENMKLNLKLNELTCTEAALPTQSSKMNSVEYKYLLWESASEAELKSYQPDIILGADVTYNPSCIPHLIRILGILLRRPGNLLNGTSPEANGFKTSGANGSDNNDRTCMEIVSKERTHTPAAYIAMVIRTVETFNYFLEQAKEAHLTCIDITQTQKPMNLLPYLSYDRDNVRLYKLFFSGH